MIDKFEIYDRLVSNQTELNADWKSICTSINSLPIDHSEIIYAMIIHHYLLDMKNKSFSPNLDQVVAQLKGISENRRTNLQQPYGVRIFNSGRGVMFTLSNLPQELQRVIGLYVTSITN